MATGPALKYAHSHSAIHESALNEAKDLTELLESLLLKKDYNKALEVAYITVEHWETRTLRHAEAEEEEEGLYWELVKNSPELKDTIIALIRDHELLRLLVEEIKDILANDGVNNEVLHKFQALIHVNAIHSQDEIKLLPKR